MSESTTPAQCRDEDWSLARDCGLMAAAPGTNAWDAALARFADGIRAAGDSPAEILAARLIDAWCAAHDGQIPWAKAVEITAATTKMSEDWREKLLGLDEARALLAASPFDQIGDATAAARDVLAERRRQVEAEGWTPEHDDEHSTGEMAVAAACYLLADTVNYPPAECPDMWPWAPDWWKPRDDRRNLVRAGALILAEIERLDRAAMSPSKEGLG